MTGARAGARAMPRDAGVLQATDRHVAGLVSVLFALPNLVLATGFRLVPGALLALATVASLAIIWRGPFEGSRPVRPAALASCLGLAFLLLVLGGALHVVYANPDWLIRDAVLADLARHGFPLGYAIDGDVFSLRAPLGMYLVPALAGRAGGLLAAHGAMLAQNTLVLGSTLYLLLGLCRSPLHLAMLVGFGGLGLLWRLVQAVSLGEPGRLVAFGRPLDEWNALFQYSSSVTQIFWVPNHALPGWWLGTLSILYARRRIDVATFGVTVGLLVLWSPLAILGAVPVLGCFVTTRFRPTVADPRAWLGGMAAAGFLPVALYVSVAAGTIDHGSSLEKPGFLAWYGVFLVLQLAAGLFAILHRDRIEPDLRGLFAVSLALLVLLPWFSFGPNNDLVMRASIPALLVVSFVFGSVTVDLLRERAPGAALGVAIAVLGLAPASVEIARALIAPRFAISDCDLVEASRSLGDFGAPSNYMARLDRLPAWLVPAPATILPPPRAVACWPDLRRPDLSR